MKTKILTLLAASCLAFLSACSDDSEGSKSLAEKCENLTDECLVGTWTLKGIVEIGNPDNVVTDFSASQGGSLEFSKDGIYHYVRIAGGICPGSLDGAIDDKGTWTLEESKLDFFQNKQGDCVEFMKHHPTNPTIEVVGETVRLYLNTVIFQQAESQQGNYTEMFERTE